MVVGWLRERDERRAKLKYARPQWVAHSKISNVNPAYLSVGNTCVTAQYPFDPVEGSGRCLPHWLSADWVQF